MKIKGNDMHRHAKTWKHVLSNTKSLLNEINLIQHCNQITM